MHTTTTTCTNKQTTSSLLCCPVPIRPKSLFLCHTHNIHRITNLLLMFSVAFVIGGMYFINRIPPEGVRIGSNTYQTGQLKTVLIGISVVLFFFSSTIGTVFWVVGMSSHFIIFIYIILFCHNVCLICPPPTLPQLLTLLLFVRPLISCRCQRCHDPRTRCSDAGGCRGRIRFCRLKEEVLFLSSLIISPTLCNKSPHSFIFSYFSRVLVGSRVLGSGLSCFKICRYH